MIIFKVTEDLKKILLQQKSSFSLGLVPTMGALHEGHLSLIERAKAVNSHVMASIFVNPTQFNDPKDFEKYPKTIENDILMLENAGCDFLFLPDTGEMYPNGISNLNHYELGEIEDKLEGFYRPGHFQGVCNIVDQLFEIIMPDDVYFGQKDYQQCLIIKKMMFLRGYTFNMHICPIIREKDGLAMSSRNMRLDLAERAKASKIYQILLEAKHQMHPGSISEIRDALKLKLNEFGFRTEYLEFSDPETLDCLNFWNGSSPVIVLIAAYLGDVRLIDNLLI